VNHYRIILDQLASSLIIAPNTFCFRIRRRTAENSTEHLQSLVHPPILIDRGQTITFNARDEKDD
jgi:hypothetical protein